MAIFRYSPLTLRNAAAGKPSGSIRHCTRERSQRDAICSLLDNDRSAVLVFRPSERFYYAVRTDSPGPQSRSRHPQTHAVVAVGYGATAAGRHILIRNSWGSHGPAGPRLALEINLAPRLTMSH